MNKEEKIKFVHAMLRSFERNLHAFENCFVFETDADLGMESDDILYSCPGIWLEGELFHFAVRKLPQICVFEEPQSSLLFCRAADCLAEVFQIFEPQWRGEVWFYDPVRNLEYTSESLAEAIFCYLYDSVSVFYAKTLGVDFAAITAVAEMAYEKDAARGKIVLCTGADPDRLNQICSLQTLPEHDMELKAGNTRLIRRLFAGAGKGGLLFTRKTDRDVYCYCGYVRESCLLDMFTVIEINGEGSWTLRLAGRKVFDVKGNRVYLPLHPMAKMQKSLTETLGEEYVDMLPALGALSQQKHGTSIVFMQLDMPESCAAVRMSNLVQCGRAFPVKPVSLLTGNNEQEKLEMLELLRSISRIDGAIIVDYPSRSIRYNNVIVDGRAMPGGQPDAGARHNALYGFIEDLKKEGSEKNSPVTALAFVFSEDGNISAYSTLAPTVPKKTA